MSNLSKIKPMSPRLKRMWELLKSFFGVILRGNIYLRMREPHRLEIRCHLICFRKELLKLELRKCKSLAKPSWSVISVRGANKSLSSFDSQRNYWIMRYTYTFYIPTKMQIFKWRSKCIFLIFLFVACSIDYCWHCDFWHLSHFSHFY